MIDVFERYTNNLIILLPKRIRFRSLPATFPMHMIVVGPRGVGKTTMLAANIVEFRKQGKNILYVYAPDVDDLYELAEEVFRNGYDGIFVDEIHAKKQWVSQVMKLYEFFKDKYIWITGSSGEVGILSPNMARRYRRYLLPILSLREFYFLNHGLRIEKTLDVSFDKKTIYEIIDIIRTEGLKSPSEMLSVWLSFGTRPFFISAVDKESYKVMLTDELEKSIHIDIISVVGGLKIEDIEAMYGLVRFLRYSSIPRSNISDMSRRFGISKDKLYKLLGAMHDAFIITVVKPYRAEGRGKSKFFLYDPALYEDKGNMREALFVSVMRSLDIPVYASKDETKGDFVIVPKGEPIYVEIGGKKKEAKKADIVFRDDIVYPEEIRGRRVLPMWVLGFLW